MKLTLEKIDKEGFAELLKLSSSDKLNLHFKMDDGEEMSFTDVPFDVIRSNIAIYRRDNINGHRADLFIENSTDDFDDLDELQQ